MTVHKVCKSFQFFKHFIPLHKHKSTKIGKKTSRVFIRFENLFSSLSTLYPSQVQVHEDRKDDESSVHKVCKSFKFL